jgi:CreA protein
MGLLDGTMRRPLDKEEAFSQKTSRFFKRTRIYRLADPKRHVLVYVAESSKIINGSPANSIDVVPVQPWPQTQ